MFSGTNTPKKRVKHAQKRSFLVFLQSNLTNTNIFRNYTA